MMSGHRPKPNLTDVRSHVGFRAKPTRFGQLEFLRDLTGSGLFRDREMNAHSLPTQGNSGRAIIWNGLGHSLLMARRRIQRTSAQTSAFTG